MGKKIREAQEKIESGKQYTLEEALSLIKESSYTKFDETIDLAINLGIDPRKSDQMVRGSVVLPNGLGKKVRVLVFAKGEKEKEAEEAGADFVGGEVLVEKISKGWLDFDKAVATPDMMGLVGRLGKILGPRGLMPNPKLGTVTFDISKTVREIKAGKVEYKAEKAGIVHVPIGKVSFDVQKLLENAKAVIDSIQRAKPPTSRGKYLQKVSISSTMGLGIPVGIASLGKGV